MQRRNFFKTLFAATLVSAIVPSALAKSASDEINNMIKPKRLKAGDTIGLIAPASNVWQDEDIYFASDVLKSFGFKVKHSKNLFKRYGYLAGQDKERAEDVNAMFADKTVDGIFCIRGGYGTPRMLPYVDYDLIKKNPKAFIGYSDITALLNAITARTGLITFHGPIAKQNFSDYTLASFKNILFNPSAPIELATPPLFEAKEGTAEQDNRLTVLHEGKATGRLIGGNLSLMVKLVGSPFEPDYTGKVLFLEEIEEAPYRVDGMLTHLWLAGRLDKLAGVVFGKCSDCDATEAPSLSVEQVLRDRLASLNIPVLSGVMIGHIEDLATIPVGALATLDTSTKRLVLEEKAVI
ncbi:S66 peptidase family protein [Candidatus Colwellia aromaticivorans]|uniref:S66 peptidase family protein n=1 Tax=Candidatus Colwellia aromaticivorans TaxID=2267621 RepID=UPI000DF3BE96|nr:LD-carboxypeptidase [Candidatus Colwellia aromaticivorans]